MNKQYTRLVRPFLLLWLFTAIGIFLHELAHHLVGVSSMMSFSRNWPLEAISTKNIATAIFGSIAGPTINLIFSYIALLFFRYYKKSIRIRFYWMLWGLANSFLVFSAAIINLTVDMISGNKGNDLQVVSRLWDINIFILPTVFVFLAVIPFKILSRDYQEISPNKFIYTFLIFLAWLLGGLSMMLLDSMLGIKFRIV